MAMPRTSRRRGPTPARASLLLAALVTFGSSASPARASELDAAGNLVAAPDAVLDVVVVQKESDLLQGVDTTLVAARAWLLP